jgi:integrase
MGQTSNRGQIIDKGANKWMVRIFRGRDASGKKQYFNKLVNGRKSDAQKYLTAKLREKDVGAFVGGIKLTLGDHLDSWLQIIRARVEPQTYNSYETALRVHVRNRLAHKRLSEIKIHDVQAIYNEMKVEGLSPRTIRYTHAVLAMALKKAIELDYIVKNPCDFVELPKQTKDETKAMSPEQASVFLQCAQTDRHGLVFEVALISGMRPEEYLSLRWADLDVGRNMVSVRRAVVWVKGGGFKFGEPKTAKSRRSIPLPANLVSKLKAHRKRQLEYRLQLGSTYSNLDLVFASETGGPLHYRNLTQRHYEKILKVAGLESAGFVLYSLRHTCATLLLAAGENPKVVADRLGHSSVKTTLDTYSHVLPDMQRSASDKLDGMLYQTSGAVRIRI